MRRARLPGGDPSCRARPTRKILNHTDLLAARRRHGAAALREGERDALSRIVGDPSLLGMTSFLLPDRAQALAGRARLMLMRDEVLRPGEF